MKRTPLKRISPLKARRSNGLKIRIDPLDQLFSEFIRKRAMQRVGGCERCCQHKENFKELQNSHFHKRRKISTRYDEFNCNGFCFGCHQYFEENDEEYKIWLIALIGEREFDMLNSRMRITHPKPDKQAITLYLKEQIKRLEDGQ